MNKHYITIIFILFCLILGWMFIPVQSTRSGGHQDANSISFYVNNEKLHFICRELNDRIYKDITIVKNENEEIPFFSNFHKNGTFDLRSTEKVILTETDSLFFNNSKIAIPVLTLEYTIDRAKYFWEKEELKIIGSKPNIPIQISEDFIDSVNNKITNSKFINSDILPEMEDYRYILEELFLATLTGNETAQNNLINLNKIYAMSKHETEKWLRYLAIIEKREEAKS